MERPSTDTGNAGHRPGYRVGQRRSCYLTWVGFGPGENESGIVQARLDPDAGRLLESPRKVWQGTGLRPTRRGRTCMRRAAAGIWFWPKAARNAVMPSLSAVAAGPQVLSNRILTTPSSVIAAWRRPSRVLATRTWSKRSMVIGPRSTSVFVPEALFLAFTSWVEKLMLRVSPGTRVGRGSMRTVIRFPSSGLRLLTISLQTAFTRGGFHPARTRLRLRPKPPKVSLSGRARLAMNSHLGNQGPRTRLGCTRVSSTLG